MSTVFGRTVYQNSYIMHSQAHSIVLQERRIILKWQVLTFVKTILMEKVSDKQQIILLTCKIH